MQDESCNSSYRVASSFHSVTADARQARGASRGFQDICCLCRANTVDGDKAIHHVEISSIQDWVGMDLVRSIKFEGERVVLARSPALDGGKIQTFELIWQRLPAC
jgi:lipocalin-like protein